MMTMQSNNHRYIRSPPIECHWAGWRSDTLTLQKHGWKLATNDSPRDMSMRMIMEHPGLDAVGYSEREQIPYEYFREMYMNRSSGGPPLAFRFSLARDIQVNAMGPPRFYHIDAEPELAMVDTRQQSIRDLMVFRRMPEPKDDLIVVPPTFDEILNMALENQAPKQKELRDKYRSQERGSRIIRVAA